MPEIPDFELDVYHENEIEKIKLSDNRGKWLCLIFYPTGRFRRAFGTLIESEGLALRGSFVIDPDGVLKPGLDLVGKIRRVRGELGARLSCS